MSLFEPEVCHHRCGQASCDVMSVCSLTLIRFRDFTATEVCFCWASPRRCVNCADITLAKISPDSCTGRGSPLHEGIHYSPCTCLQEYTATIGSNQMSAIQFAIYTASSNYAYHVLVYLILVILNSSERGDILIVWRWDILIVWGCVFVVLGCVQQLQLIRIAFE